MLEPLTRDLMRDAMDRALVFTAGPLVCSPAAAEKALMDWARVEVYGRPCLWCGMHLQHGRVELRQGQRRVVVCECRAPYDTEIVQRTSRAEWWAMFRRDGYSVTRQFGMVVITNEREMAAWLDAAFATPPNFG